MRKRRTRGAGGLIPGAVASVCVALSVLGGRPALCVDIDEVDDSTVGVGRVHVKFNHVGSRTVSEIRHFRWGASEVSTVEGWARASDPRLALYEALVGLTQPSRVALEQLGFAGPLLDVELPRLAESGLVSLLDDGTIAVADPQVAIPRYAAELERLAASSRSGLGALADRYREAQDAQERAATFDVTVTSGIGELDYTRAQVLRAARTSIEFVAARTPTNDHLVLSGGPDDILLRGGLTRRLVLDSSILDVEGTTKALARLTETGAQVRLMPTLALSVLVTDRSIAIVDITNHDPSGYGCIVVRHTPLVMALNELVDASFAGSTEAPRARADARSRFGARQAQTLALLAAGATDSTIARQVGVSQRTVERFVRTILDDLGASTRFQAGAQAERAGLL